MRSRRKQRGGNTAEAERRIQKWIMDDDVDAFLDLRSLHLEYLPELPDNVKKLYCQNNWLLNMFSNSSLKLPKDLTILDCHNNQLTELPPLPKNLVELHCSSNHLTELPELPDSITILYCDGNNLTSLPELPDSCIELFCQGNKLTSLPKLPDSLTQLFCEDNKLPKEFYTNGDEENADEDPEIMEQYINRIRPLIKKRSNLQKNLKYHITNPKREKFAINLGTHKNNPLHRFAMKNIANFMDEKNLKNINTNSLKPSNVEFHANRSAARRRTKARTLKALIKKEATRKNK